ncbi:unnamed protein product [Amoebophrya sp. A120]|nr:unnamed protein product [Amoebophrya sp. A120]|eukprot:GSA120T00023364001.1
MALVYFFSRTVVLRCNGLQFRQIASDRKFFGKDQMRDSSSTPAFPVLSESHTILESPSALLESFEGPRNWRTEEADFEAERGLADGRIQSVPVSMGSQSFPGSTRSQSFPGSTRSQSFPGSSTRSQSRQAGGEDGSLTAAGGGGSEVVDPDTEGWELRKHDLHLYHLQ